LISKKPAFAWTVTGPTCQTGGRAKKKSKKMENLKQRKRGVNTHALGWGERYRRERLRKKWFEQDT